MRSKVFQRILDESKYRPFSYKFKNWLDKFTFLKALNSPFKPFKLKWYCGKVAIGIPYFFPRKWVKSTPERAKKAALDEIEKIKHYNKINAHNEGFVSRKIRPFEDYYKEYLKYTFPVQIGRAHV